jgi:hypothetical protein
MAEYGLILDVSFAVDKLSKQARDSFWGAIVCGEIFGSLKAMPEMEIREQLSPEKFAGFVPELLLRMAEACGRTMRTQPSPVFADYIEVVFSPTDVQPEWLTAERYRRSRDGGQA